MELGAADASTGSLSCPSLTREAFFAARREHLQNFLLKQGPATTGGHGVGSSSARVAVSTGNGAAEPSTPPVGWTPSISAPPVDQAAVADRAAVVARLQANHTERGNDTTRPAPLYFGSAKP